MVTDYPNHLKVDDALSCIVAQSPKQVSRRSGVTLSEVKKTLKKMVNSYSIEERDGTYRIGYSEKWPVAITDLPLLGVGCAIEETSSRIGYRVKVTDKRKTEDPVTKKRTVLQSDLFMPL